MNDHLTFDRLGQVAKVVRIIYMIARGTLDENIWDQLQNKHQVVGATVGKYGCFCLFASAGLLRSLQVTIVRLFPVLLYGFITFCSFPCLFSQQVLLASLATAVV